MHDKFSAVPVDLDTRVIKNEVIRLGDLDALYQKWNWDGINAESIIFLTADIEKYTDEAIEAVVKKSDYYTLGSQLTLKRGDDGYTFVNFNFKY